MAYKHLTNNDGISSGSAGKNSSTVGTTPPSHPILQLQETIGNRAVQRLANDARIHAQRQSSMVFSEESADLDAAGNFSGRLEQVRGLGSPLPSHARAFLEPRLGTDLGPVRVHTGNEAHELAGAVNATAFTTGTDIFFRDGAYSPGSSDGMRLLAHEATHVVQQSLGAVDGTPVHGGDVAVSDPSDRFEQEADHVAGEVMSKSANEPSPGPEPANAGQAAVAVQCQEDEEGGSFFDTLLGSSLPFLGQAADAASGVAGLGGPMFGPIEMMKGLEEGGFKGGTGFLSGAMETVGGAAELASPFLAGGGMAAGMAESLGGMGPAGGVLGAGLGGWEIGEWMNETTGADEAVGDELFDVLGPGPGMWLADTFGL